MATCAACSDWHLRPDDAYCGACGTPTIAVAFGPGDGLVRLCSGTAAVPVAVSVRNAGELRTTLTLQDPGDLHPALRFEDLPAPIALAAGEEAVLRFKVQVQALPKSSRALVYAMPLGTGHPACAPALRFYQDLPPAPRARLVLPPGDLCLTPQEPLACAVLVDNAQGGAFLRVLVAQSPAWLRPADAAPVIVPPLSEARIPFHLHWNPDTPISIAYLQSGEILLSVDVPRDPALAADALLNPSPNEAPSPDTLDWTPLDSPLKIDVPELCVRRPPSLALRSFNTTGTQAAGDLKELDLGRLSPHQRKTFAFQLHNLGGSAATVTGMHVGPMTCPNAMAATLETPLPITVDGGRTRKLLLSVEADAFQEGMTRGRLILETEQTHPFEVPLILVRQGLRVLQGILAIDFGTTNSCIAHAQGHGADVRVVRGADGQPHFPSCLYFPSPTSREFGREAKDSLRRVGENGVAGIKRVLLGPDIKIHDQPHSPQQLVQTFLSELLGAAYAELGGYTRRLALTVPVAFSGRHRRILKEAVRAAAPEIDGRIRLIDEPTAAAMHYCSTHEDEFKEKVRTVLVYDFGGGTLDVSVVRVEDGNFTILARRGNRRLGGVDIDRIVATEIVDHICGIKGLKHFDRRIVESTRREFEDRYAKLGHVRAAFVSQAEACKIELATRDKGSFEVDRRLLLAPGGEVLAYENEKLSGTLTQERFRNALAGVASQSVRVVTCALQAAGLEPSDIDLVLMTGQVSHTQYLREVVRAMFPESTAIPDPKDFDLKTCVALGAAAMALRIGEENASCEDTQVGNLGHLGTGTPAAFHIVIPEGHAFGSPAEKTIPLKLDERGVADCEILLNSGNATTYTHTNPDFESVATVFVDLRQHAGAWIEMSLGLDLDGLLTAAACGQPCSIQYTTYETDEAV